MEASSSSHPDDSNQPLSSSSKFLANLPSRGFLSSAVISSNTGGMRVYICEHDTSPPESQQIKTNQTNILIRSLQLKKQKGDSSSKDVKRVAATEGSRKRALERTMDGRTSCKRNNNQLASGQEGSSSRTIEKDFYSLTVERLRALLKERGLSPKGKKQVRNRLVRIPTARSEPLIQDELVARLRSANG